MLNTVTLMGRITADPELKYTKSNTPVCTFCIAVERDFKENNERIADFINIVAWKNRAEFVTKFFKKGRPIVVDGRLETRKYIDKDGNNRIAFEVIANNLYFCDSNIPDNNNNTEETEKPQETENFSDLPSDDDLPF